jgi:hypothetical protein
MTTHATIVMFTPSLLSVNIYFLGFRLVYDIFDYHNQSYHVMSGNAILCRCNTYNEALHYCQENEIEVY